jgi:superfamily II DNA or RNA helicase
MLITHRKELIRQDREALRRLYPHVKSSVWSAGLGEKDASGGVVFAGVGSLYRNPMAAGDRRIILIDEAHLVAPTSEEGTMYGTVLGAFGEACRIGLSATPYRLDSGLIYGGEGAWFRLLAYHMKVKELVGRGMLTRLVGARGAHEVSTEGIRTRMGEFVSSDLSQAATDEALVKGACREAIQECRGRKHILAFACGISHGEMIAETLRASGEKAMMVSGVDADRDERIRAFEGGKVRWLINCQVLTTGYDFPAIDAIVMLRPTASKGLYEQMVGRGMRLFDGKEDCLIVDFAGNILRHGAIGDLYERVEPTAEQANEEREEREKEASRRRIARHGMFSVGGDPMEGLPEGCWLEPVIDMDVRVVQSKKLPEYNNVMVTYYVPSGHVYRKWLCPEYITGARWYAKQWARDHGFVFDENALTFAKRARASSMPVAILLHQPKDSPYASILREYAEYEEPVESRDDAA